MIYVLVSSIFILILEVYFSADSTFLLVLKTQVLLYYLSPSSILIF